MPEGLRSLFEGFVRKPGAPSPAPRPAFQRPAAKPPAARPQAGPQQTSRVLVPARAVPPLRHEPAPLPAARPPRPPAEADAGLGGPPALQPARGAEAAAPPAEHGGEPRRGRRVAADENVIARLLHPRFGVPVLTAEGGPLKTTEAQRTVACFLGNGWLLLSKHDPLNPLAMQMRADILGAQRVITQEYLVDLDIIGNSARMPDRIGGVEAQEFQKHFLALVKEAAERRCSDIHVMVGQYEADIQMRMDGQIEDVRQVKSAWASILCAAAFNMADASDTAYKPLENQGARISRVRTPLPSDVQAIRLQFNPLANGGRHMVCRLLYENSDAQAAGDIDTLGYNRSHIIQIKRMRKKTEGINIISGPTGSGKSTTLQQSLIALMREKPGKKVITIEDPPEYIIPRAVQLPVLNATSDDDRGTRFHAVINGSLRSDPDVIMIGEMRDRASAVLAFIAAMSGHQVWTSLHANNATAILTRLRDMGVEDYKLCDHRLITGLIGQRLIRRLCTKCRVPFHQAHADGMVDPELARQVLRCTGSLADGVFVAKRGGCPDCHGGTVGREVIAECIVPDRDYMKHIRNGEQEDAIRHWLDNMDGLTMLEHAIQKMTQGICSPVDVEDVASDLAEFDTGRAEIVFGKLYE